ncbi:ABC transporter permease [Actinomadura sp. ATCC 31491]|uniref:Transport permease protein n=1 Tax=Actinomadura luzonensis TaxID=2805427 RepID=A0ABT0G0B1_9ACTN|nr:ABC transporter permease [Actinomadura luzonensis]MCK2218037.1 ABC transporter permease [Actinomadura luzonensis]
MNPVAHAVRLGAARGWIEFKQHIGNPQELWFDVVTTAAVVVVIFLQRGSVVPGTTFSLAAATLPSVIGMSVALHGVTGGVAALAVEREDGTLLRVKALPQGMVGYLVARVVSVSANTAAGVLVMLVAGLLLVPGLTSAGPGGWLAVAWTTLLGLLFALPLGAIVGSLATSPQTAAGLSMLTVGGLTAVSGVFYPIAALPAWLQGLAQVFPVYWLGLGMRSALLPDAAAAAEIGGSWRPAQTTLVLAAWAVAALLAAPPILRRMARRESGSMMEERRHRAMQRVG